jgi:hypothetical protein
MQAQQREVTFHCVGLVASYALYLFRRITTSSAAQSFARSDSAWAWVQTYKLASESGGGTRPPQRTTIQIIPYAAKRRRP